MPPHVQESKRGCIGGPRAVGERLEDCPECQIERLREGLFWLAEEINNAADAIGPVPDLAESNLRHYAKMARALRDGCAPLPFSSAVCSRGTFTCELRHA